MGVPTVLERIIATKRDEIAAGKDWVSHAALRSKCADLPPTRGFEDALRARTADGPAVIAEVKKASPSAGVIRADFHPDAIARSYEQGGATCLSVLTDEPWFQGHRNFLSQARDACGLPALRKDFIIDPWQIDESRCLGADAILLIVACLEPGELSDLHGAARALGLDVLVEVHDEAELDIAMGLDDALVGVNNRNLHDFTTDLDTSVRLRARLSADRLLVTESGIRTRNHVDRLRAAGIDAFLVGEAFMREPDPGAALQALFGEQP